MCLLAVTAVDVAVVVTTVEPTVKTCRPGVHVVILGTPYSCALPERLLGNKAYKSDHLDVDLAKLGVEMIAPHQKNHKKAMA